MSVYVLMPAFNEAEKIGPLLAEMPAHVDGTAIRTVVVDDGSDDGTADVVRAAGVALIEHFPNQGKGAALCRGVEELKRVPFDAVVWMDTDGQHLPSSLPDLVRPVLHDGVDLCVGSRYLENHQPNSAPLNRRLVRALTIRAMNHRTGYQMTDPFSGFRCFSPRAVEQLQLEGCGYESELESSFSTAKAGLFYLEVPIPRIYGPDTSKMGYRHGAFRGRLVVLTGYARTLRREWTRPESKSKVLVRG